MELLLPHVGLMAWTLIAFLIVFYILRKFAWKPILKGLGEREENIAASIAQAEKVRLEMAQLKNENQLLLQQAREERAALLKEAKETRDKMIIAAKEDAKLQAAKIFAEANASIQQQKMAAITDLKNQVGRLVVEVSEKVLGRELADRPQQEAYISKLSEESVLN